jgi:glycosyltransferase involved in cell wall biosynthesis
MAGTPAISVLTPVLNEEAHLAAALDSMRAQQVDGAVEFVFADGGSTDRTRELLEAAAREDPRVRVLDNPARQTAAGLNVCLRAAQAPVVARMDAHTLYPPTYLATGLRRLAAGDVVWVSGPQLAHGVDAGSRRVALALGSRMGTGGAGFRHEHATEQEAMTGFTGVLDRAFLERVGGWDEGWPVNQDAELGARVAAAGGRMVVVPEMAARYIPRASLWRLLTQYRRYGFYRAKTSRRHPQSVRLSHLLPPAMVVTAVVAVVGPRWARPFALAGVAAYVVALLAAAFGARRQGRLAEVATVPPILVVMHAAWGVGFLVGCLRWGPPVAGAARALRGALGGGR